MFFTTATQEHIVELDLLKEALSLARDGAGFTSFRLPPAFVDENLWDDRNEELPLRLDFLSNSRRTLRILDLRLVKGSSRRTFDFAISCPNLVSLSLGIQGLSELSVPEGTERTAELRVFNLGTWDPDYQISCDSLAGWIGTRLEEFALCYAELDDDEQLPASPLFPLLLNSKNTLRIIRIRGIGQEDEKILCSYQDKNFPDLEILDIYRGNKAIYDFFTNAQAPQLISIRFQDFCGFSYLKQEENSVIDCLMDLLSKSSSRLLSLSLCRFSVLRPTLSLKSLISSFIDSSFWNHSGRTNHGVSGSQIVAFHV